MKSITHSLLLMGAMVSAAPAAQLPRAVGQWHLNGNAEDSSGRSHHGTVSGATFAAQGLRFDGKSGSLVIDAHQDLDLSRAGTIALWCRPEAPHGALFSWGREEESGARRFAVVFDTRKAWGEPRNELRLWAGGKRRYTTYSTELPTLPIDRWTHVVVSIDGPELIFYYDAQPVMAVAMPMVMDLAGQSLFVGKYQWSAEEVFRGSIDEVAIFNQPLTRRQVLELYREQSKSFGHDPTLLSRPDVEPIVQSEAGRIALRTRCAQMGDLPRGAKIRATLGKRVATTPVDPNGRPILLTLDVADLPAADLTITASAIDGKGEQIGHPTEINVHWPGRDEMFRGVRVLNNLVWELINERQVAVTGERQFAFTQPKRRWIHVRCEGYNVEVAINGISVAQPEQMLFLPAGKHLLTLKPRGNGTRVDSLIVRSIPQLVFDSMIPEPHIQSAIPYDADFIRRHIVPHVNTFTVIESGKTPRPLQQLFREIRGTSRRIVGHSPVTREVNKQPITVDGATDFVAKAWGMTHPELDGVVADEFGISRPHCAAYAGAVRLLHASPKFTNRDYIPYVGGLFTGEDGRKLVQALVDTGGAFAMKRYLRCPATEQAARDIAWLFLVPFAERYRSLCPGSIESMIVCFGYMCTPNEFLNVAPQANYKTFLDMQFQIVATQPEFWATRGLMNYFVHYADEETSRWIAQLYRHYGINGESQPAATDPFDSAHHLADGDFSDPKKHWKITPAALDSIRVVDEIHFGWLQGRYPYTPRGDSALVMVRNAGKPNEISQSIKNLEPGRLYSFRMITGEHNNLKKKEEHAVSIGLAGVEVFPEKSFQAVFHNSYAHSYGAYDTTTHAWMNYHWVLFRATDATATLTVSDWKSPGEPGGRIGQPLMLNYLQVHPYVEE